jgi:Mor family transcriptional regulator
MNKSIKNTDAEGKTKSNYIKADTLLPKELLKEVQKYAQGQLIYIPKDKNDRQKWGASSGGRKLINERNDEICGYFNNGTAISILADMYCLSAESIKRIVYKRKNKLNETEEIRY